MPEPKVSKAEKLTNLNVIVGFVLCFISLMLLSLGLSYQHVCESSEPSTCADVLEGYADLAFETRDGDFIAKAKETPKPEDLTLPDEAVTLTACSASLWAAGVYAGPEKLDQSNTPCVALDCAPSQCLKSVQLCDGKGKNTEKSEPTITCVDRTPKTVINPFHLAFCLASIVCSLCCCVVGVKAPFPSYSKKEELPAPVKVAEDAKVEESSAAVAEPAGGGA